MASAAISIVISFDFFTLAIKVMSLMAPQDLEHLNQIAQLGILEHHLEIVA